jgi:DNA-binding NarL/FixJ family response regulator
MASPTPDRRPLRVFVVEDDEPMLGEFERMIAAHERLTLAGSATSIAEGRRGLAASPCDVAVIDLGLPDGDGSELIELLRDTAPETAVIVSTVFGDEAHVVRAIEAGARGYLLKDTTLDEFARSLLVVHEGGAPLSPQIARHLLKRFAPSADDGAVARKRRGHVENPLTAREAGILNHVAMGYSAAETAEHLALSVHTVTTHIRNIYGKLAVRNRVEAVNVARGKGYIP